MTGLELFKKIKPSYPKMKVAVLSMHDEASLVRNVLKEGINGYLLKNIQQFELRNALKQISMGYPYVSPEITKLMMSEMNQPEEKSELLTEREREILKLITREFSNKQMAEKLFISERTVETHRKNIFRKTNTNTLVGLIKFAFEHNLVE
jgi:DNA-binding NarL/FixJ family response regulator